MAAISSDVHSVIHVFHIVYRFDLGGLENGIVNLINGLPDEEFRHTVVALTECAVDFCQRIQRDNVEFVSLRKPPGHGWRVYRRMWKLLKEAKPDIVHSRNLAALEMQIPALAAGVAVRIHGEHGWNVSDTQGARWRFRLIRKAYSALITHYVAVSWHLAEYLTHQIGIPAARVSCIRNGVDVTRFRPGSTEGTAHRRRSRRDCFLVGTVGRLDPVKGYDILIAAVSELLERKVVDRSQLIVQIIGEGSERERLQRAIASAGLESVVELVGARDDIADRMREFDLFVLPSLAEGVSNTILEAMASGVPVVATAVGGNPELVCDGQTGLLVAANDASALADAIAVYAQSDEMRRVHGKNARDRAEIEFSVREMIDRYRILYREQFEAAAP